MSKYGLHQQVTSQHQAPSCCRKTCAERSTETAAINEICGKGVSDGAWWSVSTCWVLSPIDCDWQVPHVIHTFQVVELFQACHCYTDVNISWYHRHARVQPNWLLEYNTVVTNILAPTIGTVLSYTSSATVNTALFPLGISLEYSCAVALPSAMLLAAAF